MAVVVRALAGAAGLGRGRSHSRHLSLLCWASDAESGADGCGSDSRRIKGTRERILLTDLGEHLDRSELMLAELVGGDPADRANVVAQRARAEELVADNRLYRQTASANGNTALAAVLDDLEQVLVDVAASPDSVSAADWED